VSKRGVADGLVSQCNVIFQGNSTKGRAHRDAREHYDVMGHGVRVSAH
jgi:hypothetical protein